MFFLILPTCTCFSHEFRLFIRIRGIPFTTKSMLRENFLKEVKGFIELEKEEFFKDHAEKVFFLECSFERKEKFLRND